MGKLSEVILSVNDFLKQKTKDKKIVVALTGDYGTGKTTVGKLLEIFFDSVVFVNSDYFREKTVFNDSGNNYKEVISSYNIVLIKKVINCFLKDKNTKIYYGRGSEIEEKIFNNRFKKVLLLESVFVFDKHFSTLPIDYIVELKSSQKDIKKRRRLRTENKNKIDKKRYAEVLYAYKAVRKTSKKNSDIILTN